MRKLSFIAMMFMATWALQACNDSGSDSIRSANESNEVKQDAADNPNSTDNSNNIVASPASEQDAKFTVDAASGGMMEVQAAELAQQKAQNQKVKDYAAMIVRDHTKANGELKTLAGTKNITLPVAPGDDHQKEIAKLSEKSGKDFDKAYIKLMVEDHKKDIDAFEKAGKNATDPDLKAFANATLPTLRTHLESAETIHKSIK